MAQLKLPNGTLGLIVSSTNEAQQEDLFFPCEPRLFAVNVAGDPECGSLVFDLNKANEPDSARGAYLQSAFRVVKLPLGQPNAIAFQLDLTGKKDTQGGFFCEIMQAPVAAQGAGDTKGGPGTTVVQGAQPPMPENGGFGFGEGSHNFGGPLHVGVADDKHRHGEDADGNPINALHLWTEGNFFKNRLADGPVRFELEYKEGDERDFIVPAHLAWTGADWAIWTSTDFYVPRPGKIVPQQPIRPLDPRFPNFDFAPFQPLPELPSTDIFNTPTDTTFGGVIDGRVVGSGVAPNMVATLSALMAPAMVFRPENYNAATDSTGLFDFAEAGGEGGGILAKAKKADSSSPISCMVSAFGAQGGFVDAGGSGSGTTTGGEGDPWVYTETPRNNITAGKKMSKYPGGTASGGIIYHPPETDLRDIDAGMVPANVTLSTTRVMCAPGASFGVGIPNLETGSIKTGANWEYESSTGDVVWNTYSFTVESEAIRLTNPTQLIRWMSGQSFYGEFSHVNTANRTWTFPDVTSTISSILFDTVAPTATAVEGTFGWDTVANNLYVNSDGAATWQFIGGASSVTGSGVAGRVAYWGSVTAITSDDDFTWSAANTQLTATSIIASNTYSPTGKSAFISATGTYNLPVNQSGYGMSFTGTFVEAASGTHPEVCSIKAGQLVLTTAGAATTTLAANLFIDGPPTGATANYAVYLSQSDTSTTPAIHFVQASTGDASFRMALGTSHSYAFGIDNTDDSFTVSYAASGAAVLGTGNVLSISTAGVHTISALVATSSITDNGLTATRVTFAGASGVLSDDSAFTWDSTNNALTVGVARLHSTGANNTFLGESSGNFTLSGSYNTAVGYATLFAVAAGHSSTAIGFAALTSMNSGTYNTAVGFECLFSLTTTQDNVAMGYKTMYKSQTAGYNTAVGLMALHENVSGNYNTAFGWRALFNNTVDELAAVGYEALHGNTTGTRNVGVGFQSLKAASTALGNTAVGWKALTLITGSQNTGVGAKALDNAVGADFNCSLGYAAGTAITSGDRNIAIGFEALSTNLTGSGNVCIGYQAGASETGSDKLYIDNTNTATPLIGGDFSADTLTFTASATISKWLNIGSATAASATGNMAYSGVLICPDGLATAPSIARSGQIATGIYFTSNVIRFATDAAGGGVAAISNSALTCQAVVLDFANQDVVLAREAAGLVINDAGASKDVRIESDIEAYCFHLDGALNNITLCANAEPAFNTMSGGVFLAEANVVPTGNPTAGGYIYVEGGALKYRGTGGTITTMGPA